MPTECCGTHAGEASSRVHPDLVCRKGSLMCGIVGYVGHREAAPIILKGLQHLEYRGYDSAGLAINGNGSGMRLRRAVGKITNLEELVKGQPVAGSCGIGHTRWATHGQATVLNAHPHISADGKVAIVHNGIVENYIDLRHELQSLGYESTSETDSEVIAHLISIHTTAGATLEDAVCASLRRLRGVFAMAAMSCHDDQKLVVARCGPPVVVGMGDREFFVASDVPAIVEHTRDVCFLMDGDIAILTPDGVRLHDVERNEVTRPLERIAWHAASVGKEKFAHYMHKEIFRAASCCSRDGTGLPPGSLRLAARTFLAQEIRRYWLRFDRAT